MILFLNKKDLFAEKLRFSSINICFPDYTGLLNIFIIIFWNSYLGPNTYESSLHYIQEQFEKIYLQEKINAHERDLYTHITCATDTETMQFVFAAISDMIIATNLTHARIF
jgi:guanine nucleotide-binding protein G(o) subunit alpha